MTAHAHLSPDAKAQLPQHVAIIMDGNGRLAKQRGLPRIEGHRQGAESARAIIRAAGEVGIKYLPSAQSADQTALDRNWSTK